MIKLYLGQHCYEEEIDDTVGKIVKPSIFRKWPKTYLSGPGNGETLSLTKESYNTKLTDQTKLPLAGGSVHRIEFHFFSDLRSEAQYLAHLATMWQSQGVIILDSADGNDIPDNSPAIDMTTIDTIEGGREYTAGFPYNFGFALTFYNFDLDKFPALDRTLTFYDHSKSLFVAADRRLLETVHGILEQNKSAISENKTTSEFLETLDEEFDSDLSAIIYELDRLAHPKEKTLKENLRSEE